MSGRRRGGRGPAPARRIEADRDRPLALAIDTSCASDTLALAQGELVLASRSVRRPRRQGAALAEAIRGLLASASYAPSDLSAITVAIGPGAFTGMRVGIATAQGLAATLGIPTWGFLSTDGWAATAPNSATPVAVMLDARRSEVYTALYDISPGAPPQRRGGVRLQAPRPWLQDLAERGEPVLLVGDGARLYADDVRELLDRGGIIPTWGAMAPALGWPALEAVRRVEEGDPSEPLRPLYLRDHDAARATP